MTSRFAVAIALALAASTPACRAARAVIADPHEYAAYRATRTEPTLEGRLRAAERYLALHPQGDFAPDVRRAYARGEEALWVSKRGSVAGLSAYLDALPRGPHAAEARRALDARRAASADLLGARARATEERLASSAEERARARDELGLWIRRFTAAGALGAPMAAAPADLVVAWALSLPAPRCEALTGGGRRCRKVVERPFTVPVARGGGGRSLVLEIVVDEIDGDACSATIAGPYAFSRREEAASLEDASSGAARERAVLAAAALVRSTLATRGGAGPCREAPREGGGIDLACGDLRASARPAAAPGGDDVVVISRASSCSDP